jgi:hypothetical protein
MSYDIYPNSSPEFRLLQKVDGTTEMQVRYVKPEFGYTGKWIPLNTVQESNNELNHPMYNGTHRI